MADEIHARFGRLQAQPASSMLDCFDLTSALSSDRRVHHRSGLVTRNNWLLPEG